MNKPRPTDIFWSSSSRTKADIGNLRLDSRFHGNDNIRQSSSNHLPRLLIISDVIRRDLQQPLGYFNNFEIVHLYHSASYEDMTKADFLNVKTLRWQTVLDLYQKIIKIQPEILQGAEPWATRKSLYISFVTYFYKIFHPAVKLIIPVVENRPLKEKFSYPIYIFLRWWMGIYGRKADLVMYRNLGSKKNIIDCNIPENIIDYVEWGTWGIDTDEFKPKQNHLVNLAHPKILFVGKISIAKGVPWLLEAFKIVQAKYPTAELKLVGQIGDISQKELETNRNVKYIGVVKNSQLPEIYQDATIVVVPSITTKEWEEQVGMVNLQALACGVPVISTRSGAIPEYVRDGEGAILVPEKNAQAIASAVIKLLSDQQYYQKMSQKARHYIVAGFEVNKNIKVIEDKLSWLLGVCR